jgi:O-antigen/teichoic acid export membrane protein
VVITTGTSTSMAENPVGRTDEAMPTAEAAIMPSLKRRLLSGGSWAFGGRVAQGVAALATNALLARLLSPQELGAYFLAFSLIMLGTMVGSLGANYAAVRFVAESIGLNQFARARHAVGVMYVVGVLGALGCGSLYLLSGGMLANKLFHAPALAAVTGLVAGWIVVMALQGLLAETFRGFHDIRLATAFGGLLTSLLLTAFLAVLWAFEGRADLTTVMLLAAGSSLTSVLLAGWLLRSKISSLPRNGMQGRVSFSEAMCVTWPLFVTHLTVFVLTQADIWILGALGSQEEVAVYGAAARMMLLVGMPLLITNAVVPPIISEMYFKGRVRELERVLRVTATLAGIPACLLLLLFILAGEPIMGLVYGNFYRAGALVLAVLSIGQLANVWAGSCGITLMMSGHQVTMMSITVFSGLFVVCGATWAVQNYGMIGVASIAAMGLVLQNVLMLLMARVQTGVWTHVGFQFSRLRETFAK